MAAKTMDDIIRTVPARLMGGTETLSGEIPAGKALKIDTSPQGEELVDALVPAGKKCIYSISVSLELVDA